MPNLTDSCTITRTAYGASDPADGNPAPVTDTVLSNARCGFSVLSAEQRQQTWGDGTTPTQTDSVTASLILPTALDGALSAYSVRVHGYAGTWRIVAARPGREWATYQLVS